MQIQNSCLIFVTDKGGNAPNFNQEKINVMTTNKIITIKAEESRMWDCLNSAVDALGHDATVSALKKKAIEIYRESGFSGLPFLNRQQVFKNYFEG